MDFIRIGEKLLSRQKIYRVIERVLDLRQQGLSQQDVAKELLIDRTFISRLESLGEVRKGGKIALIGFPIKNIEEVKEAALKAGVDYILLMTEEQRWNFIKERQGIQLFDEVLGIISKVREHDVVIIVASNKWVKVAEALLDKDVIGIEIGKSPIDEDKFVDCELLQNILQKL